MHRWFQVLLQGSWFRGSNRRWWAGIIETGFAAALFLTGVSLLAINVTLSIFDRTPEDSTFYFVLHVALSILLIGIGIGWIAKQLWHVGVSAERRGAIAARAAELEILNDLRQRREDLPTVPRDRHLPSSGSVLPFRIVPSPRNLWGLVSSAAFSIVAVCLLTILLLVCIKGFGYGGNWVDQLGQRIAPNRFPRIPTQPWLALALFVLMVPASIWTVYHFFRQLLKLTGIGPTSIELSSYPLQPGVACRLFVRQTGRVRLQLFDVELICQEEVTYNQGTDVRTEKAVVFNHRLFRRRGISLESNSPLESELDLEIPDCAMHSFKSENNRVQWLIVVTAKAKNWPRLRRTFQVMVHPKPHAVADLSSSSEPRSNDVVLRAFPAEADRESKSGKAV